MQLISNSEHPHTQQDTYRYPHTQHAHSPVGSNSATEQAVLIQDRSQSFVGWSLSALLPHLKHLLTLILRLVSLDTVNTEYTLQLVDLGVGSSTHYIQTCL